MDWPYQSPVRSLRWPLWGVRERLQRPGIFPKRPHNKADCVWMLSSTVQTQTWSLLPCPPPSNLCNGKQVGGVVWEPVVTAAQGTPGDIGWDQTAAEEMMGWWHGAHSLLKLLPVQGETGTCKAMVDIHFLERASNYCELCGPRGKIKEIIGRECSNVLNLDFLKTSQNRCF